MMSLWDALRMNMMISYQELVRTFLKPSSTRSVILETPPNVCMESRNSYENKIDEISSLSESKEHPIDIQEKKMRL